MYVYDHMKLHLEKQQWHFKYNVNILHVHIGNKLDGFERSLFTHYISYYSLLCPFRF